MPIKTKLATQFIWQYIYSLKYSKISLPETLTATVVCFFVVRWLTSQCTTWGTGYVQYYLFQISIASSHTPPDCIPRRFIDVWCKIWYQSILQVGSGLAWDIIAFMILCNFSSTEWCCCYCGLFQLMHMCDISDLIILFCTLKLNCNAVLHCTVQKHALILPNYVAKSKSALHYIKAWSWLWAYYL